MVFDSIKESEYSKGADGSEGRSFAGVTATTTETAVSIRISERNTSTWLSLSSQASD